MQQRVTLARILAADPEVLLMDEPFAALDAMTRQEMQEELLRIQEASRKTVVFITHSIDEAMILADRIVVMSARPGRVKAILENTLPRPRHVSIQLSPDYAALKAEIWALVESEVHRHDGDTRRTPRKRPRHHPPPGKNLRRARRTTRGWFDGTPPGYPIAVGRTRPHDRQRPPGMRPRAQCRDLGRAISPKGPLRQQAGPPRRR